MNNNPEAVLGGYNSATALFAAVHNGHQAVVEQLLCYHTFTEFTFYDPFPLLRAVRNEHHDP